MGEERKYHDQQQKDMRNEKKNQKEDYSRDEMQNIGEIEDKENELD